MQCDICKTELRRGDGVFVVTTAVIDDPGAYLGVSQIGIGAGNAVVHRSCLDIEARPAASSLVEAPASEISDLRFEISDGAVGRTSVLDGIEV